MKKVCIKCGEEKPLEEFTKSKYSKDGTRGECKKCFSKIVLSRYHKNKEQINKTRRERYTGTTEEIRIRQKEWRENNPEKIREYNKRKYKKHRDKYIQNALKWNYEKLETDSLFKLKNLLRSRINSVLKSKGLKKKGSTEKIIGCSKEFLMEYIESKFIDGMSWDNRDKWHIDHIIPLSSATTEEEIYKLFHYTNLQPLWAEDNLKKSNKILDEYKHLVENYIS